MEKRRRKILKYIVKEYIKTARPISSKVLVEKYNFNLCPATIRQDMVELSEEGYLLQPHTSAGRVPTEKAYRFFVENLCEPRLSLSIEKKIEELFLKLERDEDIFREIGKLIALVSKNVSILSKEEEIFWQGLSYLFSQPEFCDPNEILKAIESFEELYENLKEEIFGEEIKVFIGEEKPFGKDKNLSLIVGGFKAGVVGILGPKRMDYQKNIALIKKVKELIGEKKLKYGAKRRNRIH